MRISCVALKMCGNLETGSSLMKIVNVKPVCEGMTLLKLFGLAKTF